MEHGVVVTCGPSQGRTAGQPGLQPRQCTVVSTTLEHLPPRVLKLLYQLSTYLLGTHIRHGPHPSIRGEQNLVEESKSGTPRDISPKCRAVSPRSWALCRVSLKVAVGLGLACFLP